MSHMAQKQRSFGVNNTTKVGLRIFVLIVLAFTYEHAVSEGMYVLGYDHNTISNLWFLRNQYAYLANLKHVSDLTPDSFHVFELFVWSMIPLNLLRVAKGICFLGCADDVRSPWNKNLSGGPYVFGLFLFSLAGLLVAMSAPDFVNAIPALLAYSPRAAIALEALVFCIFSLFFADAVVAFIQLNMGRSRRGDG